MTEKAFESCVNCGAVFEAATQQDANIKKTLHSCPDGAGAPEWKQRYEVERDD